MSRIRLLTFDLDDTLWPVEPVVERANRLQYQWLCTHLQGFAERFPMDELLRFVREQSRLRPELDDFVTRKRLHLLHAVAEECGLSGAAADSTAAAAFEVFYEARQAVDFYPGVLDTLRALAADYRLCALSNGNADIFRTAAAPFFEAAISADSCGVAKPDARIFRAALERCDVDAAETVHIGDHARTDVIGAMNAGMRAVWVHDGQESWPPDAKPPDAEIHAFTALPATLKAL